MMNSNANSLQEVLDGLDDPDLRGIVRDYLKGHCRDALHAEPLWSEKSVLKPNFFQKLLNRSSTPSLSRMESKYGGLPYLEDLADWPIAPAGKDTLFVGQLNFGDADTPQDFPDKGIFVVFAAPIPDTEALFFLRWYPNAESERAVDLEWPVPSIKWEVPIRLTQKASYRLPGSWSDVISESTSNPQPRGIDESLTDAILATSGNVGIFPTFDLEGPGPRAWSTEPAGTQNDWLELWTPLDGHWGSAVFTLMISRQDFRAGRLEMASTMCWQ